MLAPKTPSTTVSPATWPLSIPNSRFSKTTIFPSKAAPLDELFCWAVIIQVNRQSMLTWPAEVFRSGTMGLAGAMIGVPPNDGGTPP